MVGTACSVLRPLASPKLDRPVYRRLMSSIGIVTLAPSRGSGDEAEAAGGGDQPG